MEKQDLAASNKDGARVRAELNEAGSIIDLHPEKSGAGPLSTCMRYGIRSDSGAANDCGQVL